MALEPRYGSMSRDFQSFTGPGDRDLPMSEIQGYQPVSRIGEIVMNSFVDAYEFAALKDQLTGKEMTGPRGNGMAPDDNMQAPTEYKPMFHEWATVQPGMICLARKKKTAVFRQYVAAETAVPVIACAACLPVAAEKDYFFAGVARSKSVRSPDDGVGPTTDEFFTVSLGGMVTVLNTSGTQIHPGDLVEWCLINPAAQRGTSQKRLKTGPRRIGIRTASVSSPKIIGRALSFAKSGETLDVLLYALTLKPLLTKPCANQPLALLSGSNDYLQRRNSTPRFRPAVRRDGVHQCVLEEVAFHNVGYVPVRSQVWFAPTPFNVPLVTMIVLLRWDFVFNVPAILDSLTMSVVLPCHAGEPLRLHVCTQRLRCPPELLHCGTRLLARPL